MWEIYNKNVSANKLYQDILSIGYEGYILNIQNGLELCNEINDNTLSTNFLFLPKEFKGLKILKSFIIKNINN